MADGKTLSCHRMALKYDIAFNIESFFFGQYLTKTSSVKSSQSPEAQASLACRFARRLTYRELCRAALRVRTTAPREGRRAGRRPSPPRLWPGGLEAPREPSASAALRAAVKSTGRNACDRESASERARARTFGEAGRLVDGVLRLGDGLQDQIPVGLLGRREGRPEIRRQA